MTHHPSSTNSPAKPKRRNTRKALVLAACLAASGAAVADQPLWELGLGLGALHVPHYRGSDQSHDWLLPVPYFVYRGDILRSDRDGTRAVLLDTERLDFDLSLAVSAPTRNGDNRARAGMPDLSATVGFGPQLNLHLAKGPGWKLGLRMPVHAVFAMGSGARSIGWSATPVLNLDLQVQGWNVGLQGGPHFGSQRYHDFFYGVAPAYATATRPAYAAPAGAAGWNATAAVSRRLGPWWIASFVRADHLGGARFENSPLVRQRSTATYGLAASYVFKTSETRVPDRP